MDTIVLFLKRQEEGLMKPRRGFTLAAGEEKLGVGKTRYPVENEIRFNYDYP